MKNASRNIDMLGLICIFVLNLWIQRLGLIDIKR
jgi:hypothetical protein